MIPLIYVACLEPRGGEGFLVRFPDVPEAITQGETVEDAIWQAEDALAVALEGYLFADWDFPTRTNVVAAEPVIAVEIPIRPIVAVRWLLKQEMQRQDLTQVALGTLMDGDEKAVRRIITGKGASLDLMLKALHAVGMRPALAV